ncbi:MAG: DUF4339 domain-containing protein, partial [Bdellovibrionota bacterium]
MIRINEHWYLCVAGKQPKGPYAERDIVRSLKEGKLSWSAFACNPAIDMPWTRLIEVKHFEEFLPEAPTLNLYQEILSDFRAQTRGQGVALANQPSHVWYLQCNGSQFGPMTIEEAQLLVGQVSFQRRMYAWKQGLAGWIPADEVKELKGL